MTQGESDTQARKYTDWLKDVSYPGMDFVVGQDIGGGGRFYLQVQAVDGECNVSGEPWNWKGRKWWISPHMTKSEFVQTCLKAVLTAQEHEARETFKYRGQAVFGPHLNVDVLQAILSTHDQGFVKDVRA